MFRIFAEDVALALNVLIQILVQVLLDDLCLVLLQWMEVLKVFHEGSFPFQQFPQFVLVSLALRSQACYMSYR